MKKIFVITVNWNGKKDTLDCLQSLDRVEFAGELGVVVVDNASKDGSLKSIRERFGNVHIIANRTNRGFSGGNNQGLEFALRHGADYVLLVNNDTILAQQAVQHLYESLEKHKDVGVASPKIYFLGGSEFHHTRYKDSERGKVLWYAGGLIDWDTVSASHRGVDEVDKGQYDQEAKTDFATGCAMMIRVQILKEVGFFDERYYLYYEDLDLTMRIKKRGAEIRYVPGAIIWHKNAGSSHSGSGLQDYYLTRNRLLFSMTYAPVKSRISILRESLRLLRTGRTWQKRGIWDAFRGVWGRGSYGED